MTTESITIRNESILNENINFGRSEEADHLAQLFTTILSEIHESVTIGNFYEILEGKIIESAKNSIKDNWDGFGSKAINVDSLVNSLVFCRMLPTTIPIPDIYVDKDGMMEFEWYREQRKLMSVTLDKDNKIIFAALFSKNSKVYGTEEFGHEIPKAIFDNLQRVFVS